MITGLSYAYGFYGIGLNAEWIINLVSTKDLLIFNIKLGFCLAIALMYFIFEYEHGFKKERLFRKSNSIFIILLIYMTWKNGYKEAIEYFTYFLSFNALYFICFCKPLLKLVSIVTLFFIVPCLNGFITHHKKISKELPLVEFKSKNEKWYLYDTFSDKAILIDSKSNQRKIKISQINELEIINN